MYKQTQEILDLSIIVLVGFMHLVTFQSRLVQVIGVSLSNSHFYHGERHSGL